MAKQEFHKNMIEALKRNKSTHVHINKKGEWLFHETKGFEAIPREDVLGEEEDEASKDAAAEVKPKKGKNKKDEASEDAAK